VFQAPVTVQRQLISIMMNSEYGDITDLEKGFNVTIKKEGKTQQDIRYFAIPSRMPFAVPTEYLKDGLLDLYTYIKHLSYEEQQALLSGQNVEGVTSSPAGSVAATSPLTSSQRPVFAPSDFGPKIGGEYAPGKKVPICYADVEVYRAESPSCQRCSVYIPCGNRLKDPSGAMSHDSSAPAKAPQPAE